MKSNDSLHKWILSIAVLLAAFGVFFSFLVKPVYLRYMLSSCLQQVDNNYRSAESKSCEESKPRQLNVCLLGAQEKIYCADPSHQVNRATSAGLFSGFKAYPYVECLKPIPNNSSGYWNDNAEYQKLAHGCEAENAVINCDYSQTPVDHMVKQVKNARDECFSLY